MVIRSNCQVQLKNKNPLIFCDLYCKGILCLFQRPCLDYENLLVLNKTCVIYLFCWVSRGVGFYQRSFKGQQRVHFQLMNRDLRYLLFL